MTAQLLSHKLINLNWQKMPRHIAIIMDGNGRWAKQKGLPRIAGHREGAKALKMLLRNCIKYGIETLTVYAFSTENWGRPLAEVRFLMSLFEKLLHQELEIMNREGVCLRIIGDLQPLPMSLQQQINLAREITKNNTAINFNVAINYGSRTEIVKACKKIAHQAIQGKLDLNQIDENTIASHLSTFYSPDPDLLIRTSGEMRISNFLLWQIAYTEIYITDTYFPDFDEIEFTKALVDFQQRDRRFGKLNS